MTSAIESSIKSKTELAKRRKQALVAADKCRQILLNDFGATEVILCGSLAGESPWHWYSDLDLAVRGMTQDEIWKAYSAIEDFVPDWLKVDIIPLESVPQHIADRILKKTTMPDNKYLALKFRIQDELISLENNVQSLQKALEQVNEVPELFVAPTLASFIADFYTGCERISERVAVYLDEGLPDGDNWHQKLLKQMAEPGGNDRPPLWSGSLLLDLDEYRKFRHLARHIYKIELKAERVIALAENVESAFLKIKQAISTFNEWLESQS
jgi:predicted nucleotidyltransferase